MNRPRWDLEESNEPAGADLIDPLVAVISALASVNWPHVLLAALTGFVGGALTFFAIS